uniref:Uncharacterized protein n=1 Tax=Geobacter sp. (strain M21) TaxID=443144 RepID=C6E7S8_GEOSM
MKKKELPKDPDLLGSMQALKRSAASALKLARQTNTPCYVMKDGKIVDIAARPAKTTKKAAAGK